ncbi:MAG: hypothetical protein AAB336_07805 [Acidobacteriota bacterium]
MKESDTLIIKELENYSTKLHTMAELKNETSATMSPFEPFLTEFNEFCNQNSVNFYLNPLTKTKEEINFLPLEPFDSDLTNFIEKVKIGEWQLYKTMPQD